MEIRYKPDALHPDYKTVRLEDKLGEDMPDQKRRIDDHLPTEPLKWDEQPATDWRVYHSALSQCAELLDNMKDGDSILDVPKYLATHLARQSQAAQPSEHEMFESWAKSVGHDVAFVLETGGEVYVSSFTRLAWGVWQARASIAAHLAGQSRATTQASDEQALADFAAYFVKNYPENTVIHDPAWHAPKIFSRAIYLIRSQATKVQAVPRPTDDDLWDATLRDRDTYHEWADKLAEAIAVHFGVDIGEHSNANLPWSEALDAIEHAVDSPYPRLTAVREWVATAPHGENCYLTDDPEFDRCLCGKENVLDIIDGVTSFTAQEVIQQAAPELPIEARAKELVEQYRIGYRHGLADGQAEIRDAAPTTQQAAKAETAEQAEGEQTNVLPPTRGTDSQHSASVAALTDEEIDAITVKHSTYLGGWEWSGDIIDIGAGREQDFARDIEAEVARRFRAQGGNTNTESSDLAPTTSTVSAPDEKGGAA